MNSSYINPRNSVFLKSRPKSATKNPIKIEETRIANFTPQKVRVTKLGL
jgi:hypothetical protein